MNEVRREQGTGAAADEPLNPTEPDTSAEPADAAADPRPEPTEEERRADTEQWIKDQLAGRAAVSEVTAAKAEEPARSDDEDAEADPAVRQAQGAEEAAAAVGTEEPAEAKDSEDPAEPEAEDAGGSGDAEEPAEEAAEPEPAEPPLPAYQRFDITGSDPAVLAEAAEAARIAIENGECVVLPTDTVYGIGADAFDADAVQRLLDTKERGRDMPPPVLIGDASLIRALADEVPELVGPLTEKHWPGPLTVIVKARDSLRIDLGETRGTIGLRVPDYDLTRDLLRQTGPMAVSSANLSGRSSALTCDEAIAYFGNKVAVYLDGGPVASPDGAPSSMVDFSQNDHGELLRAGALSVEVLRETLPDLEDLTAPAEDPAEAEPAEAGEAIDPEPTDVGPAAEAAAGTPDESTPSDDSVTTDEPAASADSAGSAEPVAAEEPTTSPDPSAADEADSSEDIERLIEQHAGEPVPADDQAEDDHAAASPSEASPKT